MTDAPEEMKSFFDLRVDGYDEHMASRVEDYNSFYDKIGAAFKSTNEPIEVLDLGAGTGIELQFILANAPNARITAIDLSEVMLKELLQKYETFSSQIRTIADSYLSLEFKPRTFDYVVSVMTLHHLTLRQKRALYKKVKKLLVPGGTFVEGDYVVFSLEEQRRLLRQFHWQKRKHSLSEDKQYHIDIPCSEETQIRTLKEAGFQEVDVIFRTSKSNIVVAKTERA
ncbi:MAG TPA: class I SAM-dependent methyltransferase [Syntrophorhabdaceae bacterium]|nr:class I SAM-dependent methyltransferase [Syntrophorhabdaceae bacterium]